MKKKGLYGIIALCLLMLSSCLGDPATSLTMANQAGVVATNAGPGKVIYVKGGEVITSESFQNANVEDGECILFDYSIDYGATENVDGGDAVGYMTATIYENTITEVARWNIYSTLSDTAKVEANELTLSSLQSRSAYIKGNLFLFTEIKNHVANQRDSFALSYDPLQHLDGDQIYSLYLRSFLKEGQPEVGQTMIVPCAFDINDFVNTVSVKNGTDEVKFRIHYASAFGKDSLSITWKSSDVFTINLSENK
ncbi:MAG: hypothetical protein IJD84_00730 [Parabacteroides sp.]|nr:hypothetical protein [Parabacteroides sp.]